MVGVGRVNRKCLCGSIDFDRVQVTRPDGTEYITEFMERSRSKVMCHSPAVLPTAPSRHRTGARSSSGAWNRASRLSPTPS